MDMFQFLHLAFGAPAKLAHPDRVIDPAITRKIVAARSHGNVRLQAGLYFTKEDVDAKFSALKGVEITV